MAIRLSGRLGRLRRRYEDGGAIDSVRAVAVARAAVVAVVQREGRGSDERPGGDRNGKRVDAYGDEYQAGAGRHHVACDPRDHPGGREPQLPRAWSSVQRSPSSPTDNNGERLQLPRDAHGTAAHERDPG